MPTERQSRREVVEEPETDEMAAMVEVWTVPGHEARARKALAEFLVSAWLRGRGGGNVERDEPEALERREAS